MHQILEKAEGLRELLGTQESLRADVASLTEQQRAVERERRELLGAGGDGAALGERLDELGSAMRRTHERAAAVERQIHEWKVEHRDEVVEAVRTREAELFDRIRQSIVPQLGAIAGELQQLGFAANEVDRAQGGMQHRALTVLLDPGEVLEFAVNQLSYCSAEEPKVEPGPVVSVPFASSQPAIRVSYG